MIYFDPDVSSQGEKREMPPSFPNSDEAPWETESRLERLQCWWRALCTAQWPQPRLSGWVRGQPHKLFTFTFGRRPARQMAHHLATCISDMDSILHQLIPSPQTPCQAHWTPSCTQMPQPERVTQHFRHRTYKNAF